jgi:hypothetical protein
LVGKVFKKFQNAFPGLIIQRPGWLICQ